jgi:hypothetical protein
VATHEHSRNSGQIEGTNGSGRENETKRPYPKTHANYWKTRLEHRSYNRDGKSFEVAEWSVRIHYKGIRRSFDLESANKEEAATKARDLSQKDGLPLSPNSPRRRCRPSM